MVNTPEKTTLVVNLQGLSGTGKTGTANLMAHIYRDWGDASATVFSPSNLLRAYGKEHGIALDARADYENVHRIMEAEDPDFITRRVQNLVPHYNVLVLDGLRRHAHAKKLQDAFNAEDSTVEYRTTLLTAPVGLRLSHLLADPKRASRPERVPATIAELLESEMPDMQSPYYEMPKVWAMRDAPRTPIDIQGKTKLDVAKEIMAAVRIERPADKKIA